MVSSPRAPLAPTRHLTSDCQIAMIDNMLSITSALLDELVAANRILFNQGILDAFGHVSLRDPDDPEAFHLARNLAPARVTAGDIVAYRVATGEALDAAAPQGYLERAIHAGVYRARADVGAVVHSHAAALVAFSVGRHRLRPVCHMSGFLGANGPPLFDSRDHPGADADMLVRDGATAEQLSRCLGDGSVVLMRGHGATVVAPTLRRAVFRAVYARVNASLLAQALPLGDVTYLDDREARASAVHESQVDRPWELWRQQAEAMAASS